jgi:hypothetical protein
MTHAGGSTVVVDGHHAAGEFAADGLLAHLRIRDGARNVGEDVDRVLAGCVAKEGDDVAAGRIAAVDASVYLPTIPTDDPTPPFSSSARPLMETPCLIKLASISLLVRASSGQTPGTLDTRAGCFDPRPPWP